MKIVLGLGNYGDKYAYTFHNMGFLTAECLADRLGVKFKTRECDSLVAKAYIDSEDVIIAKPLTFMNLSGLAAKQLIRRYKAEPSDLIVVFDDIDIERGAVRVRESGSGGTHNGMRHIVSVLDTEKIPRVRIGIGRPSAFVNLADYVLSQVPVSDRQILADAIERACDEVLRLVKA